MASSQSKIYRIDIQMDAARQSLDDTNKKLNELDASLEGLDRNSDAAKAIITEMAKLAKQAETAEAQVNSLGNQLDSLKPGTLGFIRQEIVDLTAQLDTLTEGTVEYEATLQRLGEARAEIRNLRDDLNALNPEKRIAAFTNFAAGVVGAFGTMSVAAETFGLESSTADEFVKKTTGVIAVLQSLEAIRNAADGETLRSIKNTLQLAKAYVTAGEGASTGAKVTRAALISTGIGVLLIAVGVLVANWDRLTASVKGSEAFFTKVKAVTSGLFDSAIAAVKVYTSILADVFTGNLPALIEDARGAGKKIGDAYSQGYQESVLESNRKTLEGQIAAQDRLIEVLKARGVDSYQLEEANLEAKLKLQKQGTEDEKAQYLDLAKDLDILRATHAQKERADAQAFTQARLGGVLALEQAAGRDSFQAQLALEKAKLDALKAAADPQLAAIEAQEDAITALIEAKARDRADKRRTLEAATLQAALVRRVAQGGDEYQLALDQNALQEKIAAQHLATLRAAAQVDAAALVAARADLFRIQLERADIFHKEEERQLAAHQQSLKNEVDGYQVRGLIAEKKHQADLLAAQQAAQDIAVQIAERARIAAIPPLSFEDNLLIRVFGLHPSQLEKTKQAMAQAAQAIGTLVNAVLAEGMAAADAAIEDAQNRLSELNTQLSTVSGQRQNDESALASATGAKRDYLIARINSERAAEEKLAAEKAKAVKQEQAAAKEKTRIQQEQNTISAASTAIESVLLGIKAAMAVVDAADKGKVGYDNIALAIAAAAAIGVSIISVKNASKSLGDGGIIEGGSHASGNDVPIFGGRVRVEGGEAITPVDATNNNRAALELIRTAGRTRVLTPADFARIGNVQVLPPAMGSLGNGGVLPSGASSLPAGMVAVSSADLSRLISLTEQVVVHTQATANSNEQIRDYGPAQLHIGPTESEKLSDLHQQVADTKAAVRL